MNNSQYARLQHLLALEFPTPLENAEIDSLMQAAQDEYDDKQCLTESRQELWAERGGYSACLARPI